MEQLGQKLLIKYSKSKIKGGSGTYTSAIAFGGGNPLLTGVNLNENLGWIILD